MKNILVTILGILVGVASLGFVHIKRRKNPDGSSEFDFSLLDIRSDLDTIDVYTRDSDGDGTVDFEEILLMDPDRNFGLAKDMRFIGSYWREKDGSFSFHAVSEDNPAPILP